MLIDSDAMVSMTEAGQNFARIARLADERGQVVIMRNNRPRYVLMDFEVADRDEGRRARIHEVSEMFIAKNAEVYEELSK